MSLRKDDPAQVAGTTQPAPGDDIRGHPLFSGSEPVAMLSAENPRFPVELPGGHQALGEHLKQMGLKAVPTEGRYETPEQSYIVHGPTREQAYDLGRRFGQESVVYSQGGSPEMLYCNGPKAGRFNPAVKKPDGSLDYELFDKAPEDYYTKFDPHGYLRLKFDWDQLHSANLLEPHASSALMSRAKHEVKKDECTVEQFLGRVAQTLKKSIEIDKTPTPFPHCYPWQNSNTFHCMHHSSHGVLVHSNLQKALENEIHAHVNRISDPRPNDIAESNYTQNAVPFGSVKPDRTENLQHYPLHGKGGQVDQVVRDYGFQVDPVGAGHGRPDLDCKNYNTKWLPVHGNTSPSPGGYEDSWRKMHELSHALTEPDIDKVYGEGRRAGELGKHRTTREALRAVHWEWLACHLQRELSRSIGAEIPDETFNKELNTLMHDAVHRTLSGNVVEPSAQGFAPFSHQIPLETSLSMVREGAQNMGLKGIHDLNKSDNEYTIEEVRSIVTSSFAPTTILGFEIKESTVANEKEYTVQEVRELLAKALKDRVADYEQDLLELRQRELAKAEKLEKANWGAAASMSAIKPQSGRIGAPAPRPSIAPPGPATTAGKLPAPPPVPTAKAEDLDKTQRRASNPNTAGKERRCSRCGAMIPPGGNCPNCGKKVQKDEPRSEPPPYPDKQTTESCSKCKQKVQVLSTGKLSAHDCKVQKGELTGKSKVVPAPGSGGQVSRIPGRRFKKADVPMAKPPTANPMAVPASKPAAPNPAPMAAAPKPMGMPKPAGMPTMKDEFPTEAPMAKGAISAIGSAAIKKPGMPAAVGGNTSATAQVPPPPAAPAMPSPADHADRAKMLSSFTPAAGTAHLAPPPIGAAPPVPAAAASPGVPLTAPQPAAPQLTGLAKIRAASRRPLALSEKK